MKSNEMSLERLLLILRTRARVVFGIFAGAVLVAAAITYITPKMYTSTATLNFDFRGNPVDNQGKAAFTENTYISTQKGIIESLNVAQKVEDSLSDYERDRLIAALTGKRSVIDDLKHAILKPVRSMFSADKSKNKSVTELNKGDTLQVRSAYDWLARSVGADLFVQPIYNSRIVQVSYSSTDPKVAAMMANRFAEAYLAANLQMLTDPASKSKAWFDEQLSALRKRLEVTQSRLTKYQQEEGIVSSDKRLDTETSRLSDLSKQLVAAQQTRRNAETERKKLREVLDSGASLMTFEPVFNNSVVQKIKAEIRDLESTRVQYSNSLGRNHPKMKKIDSEIYAARSRLRAEVQSISDGIGNGADLARERERDLEAELNKQKQLVLSLKNEHDKIAILQREVESAQATYNAALNQLNVTSMQSAVEQTNVSIVDGANISGSASSPRIVTNLVLGALAGLVLGIGVAIFREIVVRRVYSGDDLVNELGLHLLGHLKKS